MRPHIAFIATAVTAPLYPVAAFAQTSEVVVRAVPATPPNGAKVDFANAKPRKLPQNEKYSVTDLKKDLTAALERDGVIDPNSFLVSQSRKGDGRKVNMRVPAPSALGGVQQEQYGTANLPYSTARADLDPSPTNKDWPYRAAGKLFFLEGSDTYVCTASLIDRGLAVTAAHCVSEYGANKYFTGFTFIPGYRNGEAPFGVWKVSKAYVLAAYPTGTAPCDYGVVCQDDVAILALTPQQQAGKSRYAGDSTGWFAYASGKEPYTSTGVVHVTQIGYPVCLDNGGLMQRNDSQGAISKGNRDNTVIGSLMCGGSSGGPWVANFGVKSGLTDTIDGVFPTPNVVIGVTSWGATDKRVKQQGASPFLTSNINDLVKAACTDYPEACAQ